MAKKPQILSSRMLDPQEMADRGMRIEELHLRFSNGAERHFRRIKTPQRKIVLIVPMLDANTTLLIREYSAGLDSYQLQLPKGSVEKDEAIEAAANRELMEEAGKGANRLTHITQLCALPGFFGQLTDIFLAEDLYDHRIEGDEPEEMEVVPWDLAELDRLVEREDCMEARSIAALYYVRDLIKRR